MASTFQLSIVAPDRNVLDDPVQSVIIPGREGYFGILAGHVPSVAALRPGLIEYMDTNNQRHFVAVSGGFAEVNEGKVTVLADAAERARDIDVSRAEAALERARAALHSPGEGEMTSEQATAELDRAMNRIKASKLV